MRLNEFYTVPTEDEPMKVRDGIHGRQKLIYEARLKNRSTTVEFWKEIGLYQGKTNEDYLYLKLENLFEALNKAFPHNWDVFAKNIDTNTILSIDIYFPETHIINFETNHLHPLKGVLVHLLYENGVLISGFNLSRTHLSLKEYMSRYAHSHVSSRDTIINPMSEKTFCTGDSDFEETVEFVNTLDIADFEEQEYKNRLELFFILLTSMVETENPDSAYISIHQLTDRRQTPQQVNTVTMNRILDIVKGAFSYQYKEIDMEFVQTPLGFKIKRVEDLEAPIKNILEHQNINEVWVIRGEGGAETPINIDEVAVLYMEETQKRYNYQDYPSFTIIHGKVIKLEIEIETETEIEKTNKQVSTRLIKKVKYELEKTINENYYKSRVRDEYHRTISQ